MKSKYCCPSCGHPILPDDPLAFLFPVERAIFDTIYRAGQAGIRKKAVEERVYGGRRNGAASPSIVSAHVGRANKKLRWIRLEIHSERGGGLGKEARYTVRRLPQDPVQREDNAE